MIMTEIMMAQRLEEMDANELMEVIQKLQAEHPEAIFTLEEILDSII